MNQNHSVPAGQKIDLFVVGAQKAGTTSLKNYLGEHPGIRTHIQKEFAYFYEDKSYAKGYDSAYKKYFSGNPDAKKLIAKNAGLYIKEKGIHRLYEHNPACQLVMVLRDPVERTYSAYNMEKNYASLREPFEHILDVIKEEKTDDWKFGILVGMSRYYAHLRSIYSVFPKSQVKIFRYEDLKANAQAICSECFSLIGVDPDFKPQTDVRYNVTKKSRSPVYGKFVRTLLDNRNPLKIVGRKLFPGNTEYLAGEMLRNINKSEERHDQMLPETEQTLRNYFAPFNDKLSELTGVDFSSWNVMKKDNTPK